LVGEFVFLQSARPDNAFVNTVEFTASTRRLTSSDSSSSGPLALLASLLYLLCLPLQRALANLLLRLVYARFQSTCMPVFSLGRVRPLTLHNPTPTQEQAEPGSGSEEEEEQPIEVEEKSSPSNSSASIRPAPRSSGSGGGSSKEESPSPAPAQPPRRRAPRRVGYTSTSEFYTTFLQRFYSQSGLKKQDDLSW
jgi:hypothetical protein